MMAWLVKTRRVKESDHRKSDDGIGETDEVVL